MADFSGPALKIERADHHIDQLETIFGDYISNNMKRMRPQHKKRALKLGRAARPVTFPKHTPTVLGDAIHNLHAALDHAYHIAADANGAAFDDRRLFPFGGDRASLVGSINGHKLKGTTPSDKVIDAIVDQIQPYPNGKLRLYDLHKLDITDKHLVLIPTVMAMHIDRLDAVDEHGKPNGISIQGISLIVGNPKPGAEFFDFGEGGGSIFQFPAGGAKLHGDPKKAFQIAFADGQPFGGMPILDTVKALRDSAVTALKIVEAAL